MASSLGESFCSRILDVGRAGERASGVHVCRRDRTMVPWGIWYDSAIGISTISSQQQEKVECEGQGSSCSLGCVRFRDDEKP